MAFFAWLEQSSVGTWINGSDSVFAYPGVLLLHTLGLSLIVGVNIVIDLRLLGFARQMPVAPLRKFYPVAWTGLALNVASGALLFSAKATGFVINPAFYVKMTSIVIAITVFVAMKKRVFGDPLIDQRPIQTPAKLLAFASLTLWLIAISAGRWIAYIRETIEFAVLILK